MARDLETNTIKIYFLSSSCTQDTVLEGEVLHVSLLVEQREGQGPGSLIPGSLSRFFLKFKFIN